MISMGDLQPSLPSPVAIPKDWPSVMTDIKDCLYNISI